MSRSTTGVAQHKKRKTEMKKAKGYVGGRSKLRRIAQGAVIRAEKTATHDRRKRKGDFRRLWITRLSAAVREAHYNPEARTAGCISGCLPATGAL